MARKQNFTVNVLKLEASIKKMHEEQDELYKEKDRLVANEDLYTQEWWANEHGIELVTWRINQTGLVLLDLGLYYDTKSGHIKEDR